MDKTPFNWKDFIYKDKWNQATFSEKKEMVFGAKLHARRLNVQFRRMNQPSELELKLYKRMAGFPFNTDFDKSVPREMFFTFEDKK